MSHEKLDLILSGIVELQSGQQHFKTELAELKTDFSDFKSEMRVEISGLKAEVFELKSRVSSVEMTVSQLCTAIYSIFNGGQRLLAHRWPVI